MAVGEIEGFGSLCFDNVRNRRRQLAHTEEAMLVTKYALVDTHFVSWKMMGA